MLRHRLSYATFYVVRIYLLFYLLIFRILLSPYFFLLFYVHTIILLLLTFNVSHFQTYLTIFKF